jgi:hypothetical protein
MGEFLLAGGRAGLGRTSGLHGKFMLRDMTAFTRGGNA